MKIETLTLKDWAGHKHKELTFEGSVIGFSGENGAGKTTILESIDYLIRGKLPQKRIASERIRSYGLKGGATHAEVTAKFSRRGKSFDIYRKLAVKGSERILTLDDGSTYSYAEQVDEQIGNILGTDVDTLANILFIPQGDLKNILFGTATEQEKLLIKILDVGHLKDAYEALFKKINYLNGKINPNIEIQIAEINYDIEQKEEGLNSMRQELNSLPKISRDLLQQCFVELRMIELLDETFRNENMSIAKLRERLSILNPDGSIEIIRSKSSIASGNSENSIEIRKLEDRINGINQLMLPLCDKIIEHDRVIGNFHKALPIIEESDFKVFLELIENGLELGTRKSEIDEYIKAQDRINVIVTETQALKLEISTIVEETNTARQQHTEINTQIKALHIYESEICGDLNCTVCGSVVTEETVKQNKQKLSGLKKALEVVSQNGFALNGNKKVKESQVETLESELYKIGRMKKFNQSLITLVNDNPQVHTRLHEINKLVGDTNQYRSAIKARQTSKEYDTTSLNHSAKLYALSPFTATDINEYVTYLNSDISVCKNQMYSLQSEVMNEVSSSDLSRLEEYDSVQDQIVKIEEKVQTTAQQINRYETSITGLVLKFPLNLEAIPQFRDKVDTAQAAAEKYEFVEQNIKLSEAMLSQLKETHTRLIKEKNGYAPILEVIKELTELKEAFGRDGLAQAYITAKFENLISATKENLKKLNVSFEIRQDPDKPLSFQYLRHDTSEAVWLPQTLMSGGQRVRLCLAFIMAVQQVLVPNLGFIILDEPSNHVDDTGTADLRDFFIRIRPELDAAGMQLIVCDHKETLSAAYTTHIKL